jgi:glycosyltransferase involved in cell wall biosynthesis
VSVTVAVCTAGRPDLLADTLAAVATAAAYAGDTEILVVEQLGNEAEAIASDAGARYIADPRKGVSRARNAAAAAALGNIVLFTDDDCLVPETWVAGHRSALSDPTVMGSFGVVAGLPRDLGDDPAAPVRRHGPGAPSWEVGHASNMAVRRDVFLALGGFDERIGPGSGGVQAGEDADVITRMLSAGHTLVSGTGEPVRHAGWRTDAEVEARLELYERGAGVCIGAALRGRRARALHHLRLRAVMLRHRCAARARAGDARGAVRLVAGLVSGLGRGVLLKPWSSG